MQLVQQLEAMVGGSGVTAMVPRRAAQASTRPAAKVLKIERKSASVHADQHEHLADTGTYKSF